MRSEALLAISVSKICCEVYYWDKKSCHNFYGGFYVKDTNFVRHCRDQAFKYDKDNRAGI